MEKQGQAWRKGYDTTFDTVCMNQVIQKAPNDQRTVQRVCFAMLDLRKWKRNNVSKKAQEIVDPAEFWS